MKELEIRESYSEPCRFPQQIVFLTDTVFMVLILFQLPAIMKEISRFYDLYKRRKMTYNRLTTFGHIIYFLMSGKQ